MLVIKDLHKSYTNGGSPLHVLKGIDLHIREGELVSIMGSSGSGKSTLLNVIGILDSFDAGTYHLAGMPITKLKETRAAELRNHTIGFVFQSFNLINYKNAIENIALPLFYQGVPRKKRNAMAMDLLKQLGLADRALHLPGELSGGQKQRIAIARALITKPKLILADEPTGALDSATTHEVMEILKQVNRDGMTVVIVTHEADIAHETHRCIHLADGLISGNTIYKPN